MTDDGVYDYNYYGMFYRFYHRAACTVISDYSKKIRRIRKVNCKILYMYCVLCECKLYFIHEALWYASIDIDVYLRSAN